MTGQLSAQIAQQRVMDMIYEAEQHRRSHAEQLDRLSGRWIPFRPRRPRAVIAPALVSHDPCR
jgi:hypothetical protein